MSMFLGIPETWLDDPTYACVHGHVSKFILRSETRGDLCLLCHTSVRMVPPDTMPGDEAAARFLARQLGTLP